MSMIWLIIIVLLVCAFLAPNWGYHNYGYAPSGIIGVILLVLLILFLMGRL